ncbi:hypothetical protein EDB81DRAFT_928634 [Dactylonectria macrodidyma]|uniref:Protein kinase domain-containing protein n=1 Tax=Dactylonectria macrodidyma TaxID=307937 RepID=A0A9P9JDY1_9HYPO|nr:hypothetical protein EDB81DRAFT_928634 [Dactylonectria macrodidyma]
MTNAPEVQRWLVTLGFVLGFAPATPTDDLEVRQSFTRDSTAPISQSTPNESGQTPEEHRVPISPTLSFGSTVGSRRKRSTGTSTRSGSQSSDIVDMASVLRMKMKADIMCSNVEEQKFVPETQLRALLNRADVEATLQKCKPLRNPATIPELAEFIITKAYKVFAILIMIDKPHLIGQFYGKNFSQEMLPVREPSAIGKGIWKLEPYNNDNHSHTFFCREDSWWTDVTADHFFSQQWAFTAPKFVTDQFRYEFEMKRHLPFTNLEKKGQGNSAYSWVEERSVHVDHIESRPDQKLALDTNGNPRVALKTLKNTDKNFAEQEAAVLETMRGLKSEHLIKAIAYYKQGKSHCFMFPWAEQGNLWEFWMNKQNTPNTSRSCLTWVFTQLTGLALAIEELHTPTQSRGGCRHGDLKPENILCFQSGVHQDYESLSSVRLVITDVGLAKVHDQVTKRRAATATTVSTERYAAPEMKTNPNGRLSRRFDIWSMGCIFLEFAIWILYGAAELEQCTKDLKNTFFQIKANGEETSNGGPNSTTNEIQVKSAEVHPTVQGWVSYIRKDWRCSRGTVLRRLVELIVDRLLIEKVEDFNMEGSDKDSSSSPTIPILAGMARTETWPKDDLPAADVLASREYRSYAPEMRQKLSEILEGLKSGKIEPTGKRPSNETPIPKGPSHLRSTTQNGLLTVPTTNRNEYTLNDNWDYTPDDAIAKSFSYVDSFTSPPKMNLCSRCRDLELWSLECQFTDSPEDLHRKARKDGCALCQLLLHCIRGRAVNLRHLVKFARVGSYLTIDDGREQPVTNFYKIPGPQIRSLQNIQMGFPKLADPGSVAHFRILREWLSSCNNTHECFPAYVDFVPTRLLDVSDNDSGTVKLLDSECDHVKTERYVALSHRWGSPEHHAKLCTFKSNIDTFKRGIEVSALPKTFQDAVCVTRGLGLCRLWIDSICIVQDDPNDWDTESKLMERVFSSAYCTIAASCASGSSDGFLKPRLKRQCVPMQVHTDTDTTYYVCEAIDDFHSHVDQSELNQRGWVMQERALSRRTIYFTETQSYWECGGGVRCETMTKMKNRKASFLGDSDFPRSADKYVKGMKIELFQDLYERYSKLALSYASDRSIAIKGLETRLLQTFDTTGGYGVFDIYLHRCLLWQRASDSLKRITSTRGSLVPSWSWMAYDGAICYLPVPFGKASWRDEIKSPFTKASRRSVLGKKQHDDRGASGHILELEAPVWNLVSAPAGSIILDSLDHTSIQPTKCVVVGKSKAESTGELYWVLLVHCVKDDGDGAYSQVYERIGVGVLERRDIALHESGKRISPKAVLKQFGAVEARFCDVKRVEFTPRRAGIRNP